MECHWILDMITHPMRAILPNDAGLPLFFSDTPAIGFGLWFDPVGLKMTAMK